jgi:alpha-tubulin suppressor-like RCC1 family protein
MFSTGELAIGKKMPNSSFRIYNDIKTVASKAALNTLAITTHGTVIEWNSEHRRLVKELKDIEQINVGGWCGAYDYSFYLAVTDKGDLYVRGCNEDYQIGLQVRSSSKFVKNDRISNVKTICTGKKFSIALTNSGELYAWGESMFGELGTAAEFYAVPTRIYGVPRNITSIAIAGEAINCVFAVTSDGECYTWGSCLSTKQKLSPTRFDSKLFDHKKIQKIVAGTSHIIALSYDHTVYTWGFGKAGECGHGFQVERDYLEPKRLRFDRRVVDIAAGSYFSCLLVE